MKSTEHASYPDDFIFTTSRKVFLIRTETNTPNPIASTRACFARIEHAVCTFYQHITHTHPNVASCSPDLFSRLCLVDVRRSIAPSCDILAIQREANTEHITKNPQYQRWLKCVELRSPRMSQCVNQFDIQHSR